MRVYPAFFKAAFSWMDPELAHTLGFAGIKLAHRCGLGGFLARLTAPDGGSEVHVMGLTFPSPFGLAAGFDKGATGTHALTDLGFGHVEIGTVTGQGQPGNPRPRLFRLVRDRAVVNAPPRRSHTGVGQRRPAHQQDAQRLSDEPTFPSPTR